MSFSRAASGQDPTAGKSEASVWQAVWPTILLGAIVFVVLEAYWRYLDAPTTRSDVGFYVRWSHMLDRPLEWHDWDKYLRLPLFTVLIAGIRWATWDALPAGVVCQLIAVAAWVASLFSIAAALRMIWPAGLRLGVLAWGLFPFTGMVYVVYPVADVLALSMLAAALYAGLRERWWWFVAATNLALIAHKAVWPVLFLMAVVFLLQRGMRWRHFLASGTLLAAYYLFGLLTFAANEPFWLLSGNREYHFTADAQWSVFGVPVFDGTRASLAEGGIKALAKGLIYPVLFLVALALGIDAARRRDWLSLAMVLPTIVYCVTLNRIELWAVMRFGHPLAVAACASLAARPAWSGALGARVGYRLVAAVLVALQLVWGMGRMATGQDDAVPAGQLDKPPTG